MAKSKRKGTKQKPKLTNGKVKASKQTISKKVDSNKRPYSLIDLFAGAGGLSIGFKWAGFRTVFANEYSHEIGRSFQNNFPSIPVIIDDIRKLRFEEIADNLEIASGSIDVIAGGPPCQGFSMANRKRIENDERNLLFLEFVRAVKYFQPKCFLIENVVGMTAENVRHNSEEKSVMDTINDYFNDLGYQISFRTFKSEEHGVPQIRRRVIIIGTRISDKVNDLKYGLIGNLLKTHYSKEDLFRFTNASPDLFSSSFQAFDHLAKPVTVWEAISDLPDITAGGGADVMDYPCPPQNEYQNFLRLNSEKVYNHCSTPHTESAMTRIMMIQQGQNFRDLPIELQTKSVHSGVYGRLESNSLTPTITTRFDTPSTGRVIHPYSHRTITVREAARLQSFPDSYIFHGSRTSQGKQVGNAVPPLVGKAIAEMFVKDFLSL